MEEMWPEEIRRMTETLTEPQMMLVQEVFNACREDGKWPIFSWLQATLDRHNLDALSVLAEFPALDCYPRRSYTAAGADYLGRPPSSNSEVFVTILGVWHLAQENRSLWDSLYFPFFKALDLCAGIRSDFIPPRHEEAMPTVSWITIRETLVGHGSSMTPIESMLVNILRTERPPGFLIPDHLNLDHWEAKLDRECLRFGGISHVQDYLSRRTIGRPAPTTDRPPVVPSPLGLAASMDYFNMAWRLAYSEPSGPFRYASAERIGRLAHEVGTGEEFFSGMSAIGDTLSNLDVRNESGSHPLDRMEARLRTTLPAESHMRAAEAIDVMRAVARIRHTGQHSTVGIEVLDAWTSLGVGYPPNDWRAAWNLIRAKLTEAVDGIREELSQLSENNHRAVE